MRATNAIFWLLTLAVAQANAAPPASGRDGAGQRGACDASESTAFSTLPMLLPVGRGDRGGAPYCLANLRAPAVEVRNGKGGIHEPDRSPVENGGFKVSAARGVGNYHWLQASEDSPAGLVTASTAHYFANPGPAPSAMLHIVKADLEIVPQPLPREHWRYRAGETWAFLVRFKGRPLADTGLRLETSGGTQQVLKTDANGLVKVTFPDDIKTPRHGAPGHEGHGREPENRFVLAVGLTEPDGRYRLTAFNHSYSQAYDEGRSLPLGLGFLALGGLLATPLTFRRKEKNHG